MIIKLDFGKTDLGDISHDILDPGLENFKVFPVDEEK